MAWHKCPVCGESWLTWDARSQLFICLSSKCHAAFHAPDIDGKTSNEIGQMFSQGKIEVNPSWFTNARARSTNANRGLSFGRAAQT